MSLFGAPAQAGYHALKTVRSVCELSVRLDAASRALTELSEIEAGLASLLTEHPELRDSLRFSRATHRDQAGTLANRSLGALELAEKLTGSLRAAIDPELLEGVQCRAL